MIYTIEKVLKTKGKKVFETDNLDEFKTKVEEMRLKNFRKPYVFTCILADTQDEKSKYALCSFYEFNSKEHIIVSPEDLAKIYIK